MLRDGSIIPGSFEAPLPTNRGEFITVLAHYHRAEIARMAGWRDRIDRTTNWAITVVAAMLSLTFSTPTAHHSVLLFGMVFMFLLVSIGRDATDSSTCIVVGYGRWSATITRRCSTRRWTSRRNGHARSATISSGRTSSSATRRLCRAG